MNPNALTLAIIGHLVGDYLLQNDWMALNKKKSSFPCFVHCYIWALTVASFAGWLNPLLLLAGGGGMFYHKNSFALALLVLFATHFIQDRTNIVHFWMTRINRQQKFVESPMAPWSLIVIDNVWHIVAIWAVWRWIA